MQEGGSETEVVYTYCLTSALYGVSSLVAISLTLMIFYTLTIFKTFDRFQDSVYINVNVR
jgi:hypothetical protein